MSLFKKDPKNKDDLRPTNVGVEPLYTPPTCEGSNHLSPQESGRDQSAGTKSMSCQSCGANWTASI